MYLNLHGLIRLEFSNETEVIRRYLRLRLGFFERDSLDGDADITVSFVDRIPTEPEAIFIGNRVGTTASYTKDSFCITSFTGKLALDLTTWGQARFRILCETGINPEQLFNFLVFFIIQPALLKKDATLVHASSVLARDKGLLFAAWRDTGKTSLMMKFLAEKAGYFSDDLTVLGKNGTIFSFPERVNLTTPHLIQTGHIKKSQLLFSRYTARRLKKRLLLSMGRRLQKTARFPFEGLGSIMLEIGNREQLGFAVPVTRIFPEVKIGSRCPLDRVFFLLKTSREEVAITEASRETVVNRMVSSLLHETDSQIPGVYEVFRFAFPEMGGKLIAERERRVKEIVTQALDGKPVYLVELPREHKPGEVFARLKDFI